MIPVRFDFPLMQFGFNHVETIGELLRDEDRLFICAHSIDN
jgi:hypothetical protein